MITLAMDTSGKYLTAGLYENERLLAGISEPCFKKQSELLFVALTDIMKKAGLTFRDVDRVVITVGPGSYTGIRIAMTAAKVLCTRLHIPLYVVDSLALHAGNKTCTVLLDARGKRAYAGRYEKGIAVQGPEIIPADQMESYTQGPVYGDFGADHQNFLDTFPQLFEVMEPVENIHGLVPLYLKSWESYKA